MSDPVQRPGRVRPARPPRLGSGDIAEGQSPSRRALLGRNLAVRRPARRSVRAVRPRHALRPRGNLGRAGRLGGGRAPAGGGTASRRRLPPGRVAVPGDVAGAGRGADAHHPSGRIHLLTARRYRDGRLYLWRPGRGGRLVDLSGLEDTGPFWDLELDDGERSLFLFKFVASSGEFEPDYANRLYVASDGPEVWTHSRASGVVSTQPAKRRLRVHCPTAWCSMIRPSAPTRSGSTATSGDTSRSRATPTCGPSRVIPIPSGAPPQPDRPVTIELSAVAPWTSLDRPFRADVRVNRARGPLGTLDVDGAPATITFRTYPEVTTTLRLLSVAGQDEQEESRHSVVVPEGGEVTGFVAAASARCWVRARRRTPSPTRRSPSIDRVPTRWTTRSASRSTRRTRHGLASSASGPGGRNVPSR